MVKKSLICALALGAMLTMCACGMTGNINSVSVDQTSGIVNEDALRLREEPSADAKVVALLQKEQEVSIVAEQNGFYQVSLQAAEEDEILGGYVKKEYIDAK
ncbi:MAG: SH3 domain-containing protein [Bacteroidales bacterium]|nr:SH3 domain-containing protein [Lachnoclostridium sp.]MCM1384573.1 SH3 domain-containing protein [Lachnoclostridium sp.]MCM1465145.1 SH3 domain-containing protein [Bacteroidales bacterium]